MLGLDLGGYMASSNSAAVATDNFFRDIDLSSSRFVINAAIFQGHLSPLLK
jgi:pyruvate dehydrogenase complex dehydrogenase (E1) component